MVSLISKQEVTAIPEPKRKRKRRTRRKKEIDNSNSKEGEEGEEEEPSLETATDITTIDRAIIKNLWIDWIAIMI